MLKRLIDFSLALILLVILLLPMILIGLFIKFVSKGPMLFWSNRVGRHGQQFLMPKFRTMKIETPNVATHLLVDPNQYLIFGGSFLRKSSLDELPQLWSVVTGKMSLVGPRPALYNQYDLIALRGDAGIDKLSPGITGWAQINGRDDLNSFDKVHFDKEYLKNQSLTFDFKILFLTIVKVLKRTGIKH